ncbi:hypothetical protein NKG05_19240 [Oerskovia sp. M15]
MPRGGWPTLPEGLAAIEDTYEAVRLDLEYLDPVLATTPVGSDLLDLPLGELATRLASLREEKDALEHLPARTAALRALREEGLGDLLDDLSARRVEKDLVGPELDLAWWSSVFEQVLAQDPALAGQDGPPGGPRPPVPRARPHAHRSVVRPVRIAAREHLGGAMRDHRPEAEALFTELLEGRLTSLRDAQELYPEVLRRLRPCIIASPTLVPHLFTPARTVDLVILDAVQHLPVELVLSALARGRQVVVVGDPRAASGSAVGELASILPTVALSAAAPAATRTSPPSSWRTGTRVCCGRAAAARRAAGPPRDGRRRGDARPDLGRRGEHAGRGRPGRRDRDRARHDPPRGVARDRHGELGARRPGARRAARRGPAESCPRSVLLGCARRARRGGRGLGVAGLSRDAIVLSVGYGRTPHGRVLHRFGCSTRPVAMRCSSTPWVPRAVACTS